MGAPVGQQDRLFYEFCLEDRVPADHLLRRIDGVLDLSRLRGELRAHYNDIDRPSICPELKMPSRYVSRDVNEAARDTTRALMETEAYSASSIERKKIEALFGEAKHILALTRLRLRGLPGARDEFLLTATVQNLKRLARNTTIPPPLPIAA